MCVAEKLSGLRASVLSERMDSGTAVSVAVDRGFPALLLFTATAKNSSFSESREMNSRMGIFLLGRELQGKINDTFFIVQDRISLSFLSCSLFFFK